MGRLIRQLRIRAAVAGDVAMRPLRWRPRLYVWWTHDLGEIAGVAGLRRKDALVLGALGSSQGGTKHPWLWQVGAMRLMGVRATLRRLQDRRFVEPGWSLDGLGVHCQSTEAGSRVARAVRRSVGYPEPIGTPIR